jgi:hypothetical protein
MVMLPCESSIIRKRESTSEDLPLQIIVSVILARKRWGSLPSGASNDCDFLALLDGQ